MFLKKLTLGAFESNCYVLADRESSAAVIIDPGFQAEEILDLVKKHDLAVKWILSTHGHLDHAGAAQSLRLSLGAPYALHSDDLYLVKALGEQALMFGLAAGEEPEVDHQLSHGEVIRAGKIGLKVLHTPGHTPGSICFSIPGMVFSGDLLFAGSVGRTDFPRGSHQVLLRSITEQVFPLGKETMIYPGHGPETRVGDELNSNPFLLDLFPQQP